MTTDPAWFYSALAQASAAIVGLVGAILGSRIIDQLQLMRGKRINIDESIHEYQLGVRALAKHTIDRWLTFRDFLIREIDADEDAIKRGQAKRTFTAEIGWNFTEGHRSEEVDVAQHKRQLDEELELLERFLSAYPPLVGEIKDLSSCVASLVECVNSTPANHPGRPFALADLARFTDLEKAISRFRAGLIPRSFPIAFVMLGWLALTGVVWPLFALPGFPHSYPKAYMLIALCVGLLGLIGYFGYLLLELRGLGRFYWS